MKSGMTLVSVCEIWIFLFLLMHVSGVKSECLRDFTEMIYPPEKVLVDKGTYIFPDMTFNCNGSLTGLSYKRPNGSVKLDDVFEIWRKKDDGLFFERITSINDLLVKQLHYNPASKIVTIKLKYPIEVTSRNFLGTVTSSSNLVFYKANGDTHSYHTANITSGIHFRDTEAVAAIPWITFSIKEHKIRLKRSEDVNQTSGDVIGDMNTTSVDVNETTVDVNETIMDVNGTTVGATIETTTNVPTEDSNVTQFVIVGFAIFGGTLVGLVVVILIGICCRIIYAHTKKRSGCNLHQTRRKKKVQDSRNRNVNTTKAPISKQNLTGNNPQPTSNLKADKNQQIHQKTNTKGQNPGSKIQQVKPAKPSTLKQSTKLTHSDFKIHHKQDGYMVKSPQSPIIRAQSDSGNQALATQNKRQPLLPAKNALPQSQTNKILLPPYSRAASSPPEFKITPGKAGEKDHPSDSDCNLDGNDMESYPYTIPGQFEHISTHGNVAYGKNLIETFVSRTNQEENSSVPNHSYEEPNSFGHM